MTLGSGLKKNINNEDDDEDSRVNFFNSNTQGREKIGKFFHNDENDKTFSLSDLKKIHGRCSTISKVHFTNFQLKICCYNINYCFIFGSLQDSGAITIWNISPAFKRSFPEVDLDINAISMNCLRLILKIGTIGDQEVSLLSLQKSDKSKK